QLAILEPQHAAPEKSRRWLRLRRHHRLVPPVTTRRPACATNPTLYSSVALHYVSCARLLPPLERGRAGRGSRAARTASQRTPTRTLPIPGGGRRTAEETMADPRITHAAHWLARFTVNGVTPSDFHDVLASLERWEDWCRAWSARAKVHEDLGMEA